MDTLKVGKYIQELRQRKNITQKQIGERLNISYQAVSKWERGESLPDTALLVNLAKILETSIDNILNSGERVMNFSKKISVTDIKTGIQYLSKIGSLMGKDNTVYIGMVEGINNKMNIDVEELLSDPYKKEALVSEIIIQNIMNKAYVDISDLKNNLENEHWINTVCEFAEKYGLK